MLLFSQKKRGSKTSSNYRKIAFRPLWAAMAGSPAPPTAGPRWSSGRSRWPRAASCCLPAGRGVRRCHASSRRHRCDRCSNLAQALVGGLEVDGGARRGNGPLSRLQIGSVRQPRWLTTRLHLGALELDLRCTLTHPRPDAPRACPEPGQKTNPCSPCATFNIHLVAMTVAGAPLTPKAR